MSLFPAYADTNTVDLSDTKQVAEEKSNAFSSTILHCVDSLPLDLNSDVFASSSLCDGFHSFYETTRTDLDADHGQIKSSSRKQKPLNNLSKSYSRKDKLHHKLSHICKGKLKKCSVTHVNPIDDIVVTKKSIGSAIFSNDRSILPNKRCFFDTGRSAENFTFGQVYKKQLAKFIQRRRSFVGGSAKQRQIVKPKSNIAEQRYFVRNLAMTDVPLEIVIPGNKPTIGNCPTIIPLPFDKTANIDDSALPMVFDSNTRMYKVVQNPLTRSCTFPEDAGISSDHDSFFVENGRLNKKIIENPNNVECWFELVEHQNNLLKSPPTVGTNYGNNGKPSKLTSNKREHSAQFTPRAVAEKKMAILDRALKSNPTCLALGLERMRIGADIWSTEELRKESENIRFHHVNSLDMWIRILEDQSKIGFISFSVPSNVALFEECMSKLLAVSSGQLVTHPPQFGSPQFVSRIFAEHCYRLAEAGFVEKALARWQALVEFNMFCPETLKDQSMGIRKRFFEAYFDRGKPLIGDLGSEAWGCWKMDSPLSDSEISSIPSNSLNVHGVVDLEPLEKELCQTLGYDLAKLWIKLEELRLEYHWVPLRSMTEEPEDPERLLCFGDVAPALMVLHDEAVDSQFFWARLQMITDYIQFLGGSCWSFWSFSTELAKPFQRLYLDVGTLGCDGLPRTGNNNCFNVALSLLKPHLSCLANLHDIENFVRRTFKCLLLSHNDNPQISNLLRQYIAACYMWTETVWLAQNYILTLKDKKKIFQKFVKSLLAQDSFRNQPLLFGVYACCQRSLGLLDEAFVVLQTAVKMEVNDFDHFNTLSIARFEYINFLIGIYGEKYVNHDLAVHYILAQITLLMKFAGNDIEALKANYMQDLMQIADPDQNIFIFRQILLGSSLSQWIRLKVILTFLRNGFDCTKLIFDEYCSFFRQKRQFTYQNTPTGTVAEAWDPFVWIASKDVELITVLITQLSSTTSTLVALTPARQRLLAAELLDICPLHPVVVQRFAELHTCGLAMLEVRRFFNRLSTKYPMLEHCNILWLQQIELELRRQAVFAQWTASSGVTSADNNSGVLRVVVNYRIEQLLELSFEACPLNHSLWHFAIDYFLQAYDENKATAVFYRAIRALPWCKSLYIAAIKSIPAIFNEVVDLMVEKGIRLRALVEEVEMLKESYADSLLQDSGDSGEVPGEAKLEPNEMFD